MTQVPTSRFSDDWADWRRRQELYRAYDGPVPPRMMARLGDGEVRLGKLIRDAEDRAARLEDAAAHWRERRNPEMARRCREDANLARDTAALNRDALDKLRKDRAGDCAEREVEAGEVNDG